MSVAWESVSEEGARVVDHDVEAAEGRDGPFERLTHLPLVTHVDDEWERLAAGFLDFLRGRVDRARQLGIGLSGLGGDRDVGAVACAPKPDREPDAARGAGDEQGLAGKRVGHRSSSRARGR